MGAVKNVEGVESIIPLSAGSYGRDRRGELERLDHLSRVLEKAAVAFRSGSPEARESALADGLSALAALYGGLDGTGASPTATHLDRVYDVCLRGLSDAYGGNFLALAAATTMARSIRTALGRTSVRPNGARTSRSPSRPSGAPGGMRRAA